VALTPDGNRAVSASEDNTLRVWDVATGTTIAVYPLESHGRSVAVTSGHQIIVGTAGGQLHFLTLRNCP
jgi:WD40 repeat protein